MLANRRDGAAPFAVTSLFASKLAPTKSERQHIDVAVDTVSASLYGISGGTAQAPEHSVSRLHKGGWAQRNCRSQLAGESAGWRCTLLR